MAHCKVQGCIANTDGPYGGLPACHQGFGGSPELAQAVFKDCLFRQPSQSASPSAPPEPKNDIERAMEHAMNCPASVVGCEHDCRCGLKWRKMLQTEQVMHAAWRKRAEEAEAKPAPPEPQSKLVRTIQYLEDGTKVVTDNHAPPEPTPEQLRCGYALYGEPALCICGTCFVPVDLRKRDAPPEPLSEEEILAMWEAKRRSHAMVQAIIAFVRAIEARYRS